MLLFYDVNLERQHEAEFRQLKADKETEVKHLEDELVAANECKL